LIETVGIEFRMELILGNDVPIYGGLTPVNSSLVDKVPSWIETIFLPSTTRMGLSNLRNTSSV